MTQNEIASILEQFSEEMFRVFRESKNYDEIDGKRNTAVLLYTHMLNGLTIEI